MAGKFGVLARPLLTAGLLAFGFPAVGATGACPSPTARFDLPLMLAEGVPLGPRPLFLVAVLKPDYEMPTERWDNAGKKSRPYAPRSGPAEDGTRLQQSLSFSLQAADLSAASS